MINISKKDGVDKLLKLQWHEFKTALLSDFHTEHVKIQACVQQIYIQIQIWLCAFWERKLLIFIYLFTMLNVKKKNHRSKWKLNIWI